MAASTRPKTKASPRSRRSWPVSRGRQIRTRTIAATRVRTKTVPPAPSSSKSVFAKAAPNWTDAIEASTSRVGGTAQYCLRDHQGCRAARRRPRAHLRGARVVLRRRRRPVRARGPRRHVVERPGDARARAGHADPRGEQVGALPRAAHADARAARVQGADDVHAPRVALAPRPRLRRPAARLPDGGPGRAG